MRKIHLLLIMVMILPLQGCWGNVEPHNFNYLVSVAFDYKDDEYYVYTQSLSFGNVAKQEAGLPENAPSPLIGIGKGISFESALKNLEETTALPIQYGQIHSIILSESVLTQKLDNFKDLIRRSTFFRYNSWVFSAKGDFISVLKGESFFNLPTIFTLMFYPEDILVPSSTFTTVRYHQFLSSISDPVSTVVIPSVSINESNWMEKKPKKIVEIDGGYVVEKDKDVVYLDKNSLRGIRWMNKEYKNFHIETKQGENVVAFNIRDAKFKIKTISNPSPTFQIKLDLNADVTQNDGNFKTSKLISILEEEVKKEIKETYLAGIKVKHDVFSLAEKPFRFKPDKWSIEQLENLNEESLQKVQVKVHIQNEGDVK
ncbi:Ger(x)C family spore germination protein [Peribacillus alkalitolerans]|uniref:Ger(x)C family spore germination protein n=1 Tax=Peribacillus alkalitolerans TaxID=1550385 RepID=UPI0013D51DB0|nr:Ger(x)C family spore germination protein [Peribacillus alkalitolerans]